MQDNNLNDSLAAVELIKNSIDNLRQQREAILNEESALIQQKKELKAQPVPLDDVKQTINKYIDARAQIFLKDGQWERNLRQFLHPNRDPYTIKENPPALSYDEAAVLSEGDINDKLFPSLHPKIVIPDMGVFDVTDAPLLFFFGDLIKEKISIYFDHLQITHRPEDIKKVGTPIAERRIEIERIDTRLHEIVSEKEEIDQKIKSLCVQA